MRPQVGISCYGEVLIGSPFPVTVAPGPTGVTSYPFGATLGTAEAGDTTAFQLQAQVGGVQGAEFRVQGSGFKVQGSGCRVTGSALPSWAQTLNPRPQTG